MGNHVQDGECRDVTLHNYPSWYYEMQCPVMTNVGSSVVIRPQMLSWVLLRVTNVLLSSSLKESAYTLQSQLLVSIGMKTQTSQDLISKTK